MNSSEFRQRAKEAIDEIADYLDSVPQRQVVSAVEPNYLSSLIPPSAPQDGEPWAHITADIQEKIMPGITHWSSPGFMAFFSCTSSYPSAIAEMWSTAFNGAHFNWICSPAVTELEVIVMDWLAKLLNLPPCFLSTGPTFGGGVIQGSASEAILTVMVAARDRFLKAKTAHIPEEDSRGRQDEINRLKSRLVVLGSTSTHSSTQKAAQILGVKFSSIATGKQKDFSLQGPDLVKKLDELAAQDLEPFFVTATFGTIDVCAVDDISGINAALASRIDTPGEIWVHVDASFAGAALILDEYGHLAAPMKDFHSINCNPQKWLLTTFDCSALWIRNRDYLTESSLQVKPAYLQHGSSKDKRVVDFRDWQIPLGRRFRSLKLWFVIRAYGVNGLRAHVRNGIVLGESLEKKFRSRLDLFSIHTPARFALLTIRLCRGRDGHDEEDINAQTKALCGSINSDGRFFLTGATIDGLFAIRICTSGAAAREEHMDDLFNLFVECASNLLVATVRGGLAD